MKRLLSIGLLLAVVLSLIAPLPVYAFLDAPLSMTFQSVKAFQNVAVDGDEVIVFHYRITYAPDDYPLTPAADSIMFRLYSSDGTLEATSRPYVFSAFATNGYKDGVSAFYFTESLPWEDACEINIIGVPVYFDPIPTPASYTMTIADYSTASNMTASRTGLYDEVMFLCDELISVYPSVTLKGSTDAGIVLTSSGEAYFRGAIPGVQTMCPQLFFVQIYAPTKIAVEAYNMILQTKYTGTLEGTDLKRGMNRLGNVIGGVSGAFVLGIFVFLGCLSLCIWTMRKGWGLETGMVAGAGVVITGAVLIGDFLFTLTMIGGLIAAMGIMYVVAYKRA